MNDEYLEIFDDLLKESISGEIISKDVSRLTGAGDNYLSLMLKIDAKIRNGSKEEILHTVAKISLKSFTNEGFGGGIFKNEINFYSKIIPAIKQFQTEHDAEVADFFPKMYGWKIRHANGDTKDNIMILLENLKAAGYESVDRRIGFDLQGAKAVIRNLATLHTVPLAMKSENPEVFEVKIKANVKEPEFPKGGPGFPALRDNVVKTIAENPDCVALVPNVKKLFNVDPNITINELWCTLIHGDCWANNILIKYEDRGLPKIKFVDFQLSSCRSIAADLLVFIFSSIQSLVIKDHLDELLRYYYENFIENLKRLNAPTDDFTFESYLEELQYQFKNGLFITLMAYMFVIFAKEENLDDVNNEDFGFNKVTDLFKEEPSLGQKEKMWLLVKELNKRNWI